MNKNLSDLLTCLKKELLASQGDNIVSIVIFGSVGRDEFDKTSDVDILIICNQLPKSCFKRSDFFIDVEEKLKETGSELYSSGHHPFLSPIIKTTAEAKIITPLYLDMVEDAMIIYDRDDFFAGILQKLKQKLDKLGSKRIYRNGKWYWDLKPSYKFGETFEI